MVLGRWGKGRGGPEHVERRPNPGVVFGGFVAELRVCGICGRVQPVLSFQIGFAAENTRLGGPRVAAQCLTRRSFFFFFLNRDAEGATQHLPVTRLRALGDDFSESSGCDSLFQTGQHNS